MQHCYRSTVIDSLHPGMTRLKLEYFYCNRAKKNHREPYSILNTIIQQLAQSDFDKNKLPKPIVDIYRDWKNKGQILLQLSLSESQGLLI
jgi:hypothetical protein